MWRWASWKFYYRFVRFAMINWTLSVNYEFKKNLDKQRVEKCWALDGAGVAMMTSWIWYRQEAWKIEEIHVRRRPARYRKSWKCYFSSVDGFSIGFSLHTLSSFPLSPTLFLSFLVACGLIAKPETPATPEPTSAGEEDSQVQGLTEMCFIMTRLTGTWSSSSQRRFMFHSQWKLSLMQSKSMCRGIKTVKHNFIDDLISLYSALSSLKSLGFNCTVNSADYVSLFFIHNDFMKAHSVLSFFIRSLFIALSREWASEWANVCGKTTLLCF